MSDVEPLDRVSDLVRSLASRGRYHFTTNHAASVLGKSNAATRAAIRRLEAKGEVATPHRGFYVIVPAEYRSLGCLPAEQFISQLMAELRAPYYVALLSAAELHGAAHQRPQTLQVMVPVNRRPIGCGKVRVDFVARKDLDRTPTVEKKTPRGLVRVASAEATALELVGYADTSGGLDNVAAVLGELAEVMVPAKLRSAAETCPIAWVQRLGYLLDEVDQGPLAEALVPQIEHRVKDVAPLVRSSSRVGAPRSPRWHLAINAQLEPFAG